MFWALTSLAKCLKSIQANVTWENQKTAEKKRKIRPNLKLPMQLSPKLHSCLFKFNNELVVRNDRAWLNEYSFLLIQQSKYKYRATHILISTRDFHYVILAGVDEEVGRNCTGENSQFSYRSRKFLPLHTLGKVCERIKITFLCVKRNAQDSLVCSNPGGL